MPGPTFFRIVDPANHATVRLDLNLSTGWMLGRGLDIGAAQISRVYLVQPPYDGATLAASFRQPVTMKVPLLMTPQTTAANMQTLFNNLATELDRTVNCIEYRPLGLGSSYFIDTYRSTIPSLHKGDFAPNPFALMQTTSILTLEIDRSPILTGAGSYI
jgi:hypothetical protein